jgi:uncharacterized damage-inducible protein DinB
MLRSVPRGRIAARLFACSLLSASCAFAFSQAAAPAKPAATAKVATKASATPKPAAVHTPPAEAYGKLLSLLDGEFVSAAEAMPEDKFDFAPPAGSGNFDGVRNFGQQVKHVAGANYYFFGGSDFNEAATKAKEDEIEKLTTKADIIKALKDSFAQAHKYVGEMTPSNAFVKSGNSTRATMAAFGMAHMMDHYGQMVVYLRMNGIVPPASQKK